MGASGRKKKRKEDKGDKSGSKARKNESLIPDPAYRLRLTAVDAEISIRKLASRSHFVGLGNSGTTLDAQFCTIIDASGQ
jgi:hypothetical protein